MAPTLAHFRLLFQHTYFSVWFLNTMSLSVCLVLVTLATADARRLRPGAPQGRPGPATLGVAMFMTYLVPPIIIFLPLARVARHARALRLLVGAGGRLSDLHDPVLYMAPDGLLPQPAPRDRGKPRGSTAAGSWAESLRVVLPLRAPGHRHRGHLRLPRSRCRSRSTRSCTWRRAIRRPWRSAWQPR